MLSILASQTAVAIENARLYETVKDNERTLEKEIEFARGIQLALLPTELPSSARGRSRGQVRAGPPDRWRLYRFSGA